MKNIKKCVICCIILTLLLAVFAIAGEISKKGAGGQTRLMQEYYSDLDMSIQFCQSSGYVVEGAGAQT